MIVWADGNNTDTVLRILAGFARRAGVSGFSDLAANIAQQAPDMEVKAETVMRWLALERNRRRFMISGNVDRDMQSAGEDA